ncbi:MAG TPA: acyltransferase [Gemmataceae bacterium]
MMDKAHKLNSLTGLRFVAAAGIVLLHSGWFGMTAYKVINLGLFVDLFFILSGFILAYNYPRLDSAGGRGRFLLARFARLWPAHALGLLLMVLLYKHPTLPVSGIGPSGVAVLNLFMIHSWIPVQNLVFSYNGPSWSIATEFGFYILFLFLIQRWERTWHVKLLLTCVLACALPSLLLLTGLPGEDASGEILSTASLGFHPLMKVWEFTAGMSAALLWRQLSPRLRIGAVKGTLLELSAVALVAAVMYIRFQRTVAPQLLPYVGKIGVMLLFVAGPLALLIVVLANERGWVSRLLGSRPGVLLGEISYTIYILHFILIHYYSEHFSAFTRLPGWLAYGVFWLILLTVCHFVYVGFERPVRGWLVGLWPTPGRSDVRPSGVSSAGAPRTLWQRLVDPSRRLLAGEALMLGCLLLSVVVYATRRH